MKTRSNSLFLLLLVAALIFFSGHAIFAQSEKDKKDEAKQEEPKDITAQVKDYNSDKYASPPQNFNKGHITPRKLDKKAIKKTETGFAVQLPSKAPIATPSVYKGTVFVSGGFHSKEYYAFDAKTGQLKWAVNLDDDGPTSAVIEDDTVIFNTESCTIFALDAKTGKQLWSWWLGDPLMSTPTIANGRVFTAYPATGRSGQMQAQVQTSNMPPMLNAINAKSGVNNNVAAAMKDDKKKDKEKKDKKSASPPPASHVLAAFDLKTGRILWQRWIDADVMSAPVAQGDELYVTTFAGTMYKFKQKDGAIVSAKQVRATSAPVIVDGDLYYTKRADKKGSGKVEEATVTASRGSGRITKQVNQKAAPYLDGRVQSKSQYKSLGSSLDAGNGFAGGAPAQANAEAAFENVGQANVSTLQAYQGSRVLSFGDNNYSVMGDEIVCNDRKTGKKHWAQKLSGDIKSVGGFLGTPPVAAGGSVFVGTHNGQILQMNPKDGKKIKSYKVGSPIRFQPVVENGMIYVGTQDGKLIAIDTKDQTLTGWPMWGGDPAHTGYKAAKEK